jgi:ribosomal protein S18 acetylase RimI-like enzyme
LERFYDAVPRDRATVEHFGGLVLFVPNSRDHAFYGRPARHGPSPTRADVIALRRRQRELVLPEALEWVHELTPGLLAAAEATGMSVLRAPLMVLDPAALPCPARDARPGTVRLLSPFTRDFGTGLRLCRAVASVGFAAPGTEPGPAGVAERDTACRGLRVRQVAAESARVRAGLAAWALAETRGLGAVASGGYQRAGDVVEIVGVATLPAARRRGLAGAVTAALARHAIDAGASTVFLSAADASVARMYGRLGFRTVGTACIAAG